VLAITVAAVVAFCVAFGSALFLCGCDPSDLDHGLMVRDGNELRPMVLPWEVVISPDMEHGDAVVEAAEAWNGWLSPLVGLETTIDGTRFEEIWPLEPGDRMGIVLVSEGFAGTPGGMTDSGELLEDPGGVAHLVWNADGEIVAADIVISSDIAYDRQTVRDVAAHEFGHAFGLAHDGSSLDLGSCMASPPEYDCEATAGDRDLIRNGSVP
jgi:hypothetical protein